MHGHPVTTCTPVSDTDTGAACVNDAARDANAAGSHRYAGALGLATPTVEPTLMPTHGAHANAYPDSRAVAHPDEISGLRGIAGTLMPAGSGLPRIKEGTLNAPFFFLLF